MNTKKKGRDPKITPFCSLLSYPAIFVLPAPSMRQLASCIIPVQSLISPCTQVHPYLLAFLLPSLLFPERFQHHPWNRFNCFLSAALLVPLQSCAIRLSIRDSLSLRGSYRFHPESFSLRLLKCLSTKHCSVILTANILLSVVPSTSEVYAKHDKICAIQNKNFHSNMDDTIQKNNLTYWLKYI